MENYIYKELLPAEYHLAANYITKNGGVHPNFDSSLIKISGVFNLKNDLIGFVCLRLAPIVEPIFIKEEYRGRVSIKKLVSLLEAPFKFAKQGKLFCTPSSKKMETLVKRLGFIKLENSCYQKDFN